MAGESIPEPFSGLLASANRQPGLSRRYSRGYAAARSQLVLASANAQARIDFADARFQGLLGQVLGRFGTNQHGEANLRCKAIGLSICLFRLVLKNWLSC